MLYVIDLNQQELPELLDVGLTAVEAEAVLRWRPFSSWDALLQVLEIDERRIAELRAAGAILSDAHVPMWPKPTPFILSRT